MISVNHIWNITDFRRHWSDLKLVSCKMPCSGVELVICLMLVLLDLLHYKPTVRNYIIVWSSISYISTWNIMFHFSKLRLSHKTIKARSPVDSPHKGQWRGALTFSLICASTNGWANNWDASDLRCHRAHHDVTVMSYIFGPIIGKRAVWIKPIYSYIRWQLYIWFQRTELKNPSFKVNNFMSVALSYIFLC